MRQAGGFLSVNDRESVIPALILTGLFSAVGIVITVVGFAFWTGFVS
jgi:hypothetical protein